MVSIGSDKVVATISVGSNPDSIAIAPNGQTAYVANYSDKTITPINTSTNHAEPVIALPGNPAAISVGPSGSTAYVATGLTDTVVPIYLATGTVETPVTVGSNAYALAVTPDQAPVASFTATPSEAGQPTSFDATASSAPSSGIATYQWTFGDGQQAVSSGPTISHLYAGGGQFTATVTLTDADGTSLTQSFTGQTVSNNGGPGASFAQRVSIPYLPTTAFVVNSQDSTVIPIDTAMNVAGPPIAVGGGPTSVAITPNGRKGYVVDNSGDAVTPIDTSTDTPEPA